MIGATLTLEAILRKKGLLSVAVSYGLFAHPESRPTMPVAVGVTVPAMFGVIPGATVGTAIIHEQTQ